MLRDGCTKMAELGDNGHPFHTAALLHLYAGTITLEHIAAVSGLNTETLCLFLKRNRKGHRYALRLVRKGQLFSDRTV
jgi:hypothetical protein